jgi:rSAM/selenodomain-associated transferase 2
VSSTDLPPAPSVGATISVVVPARNEAAVLRRPLEAARRGFGPDAELIVVDGGSTDATPDVARGLAQVIAGPSGRGAQLNRGARRATGEILVFLHADTLVPPDAGERVRDALVRPERAWGCFTFALTPVSKPWSLYRLLEGAVRVRTQLFRTATGDQVLFSSREAFEAVGGFPATRLFEDVEMVRRLRRLGRMEVLDAPARTSRRRWEREGFWRTVLRHWALRAGHALGLDPDRLARTYEVG